MLTLLIMWPAVLVVVFFAILGLILAGLTYRFLKPFFSQRTRIVAAAVLGLCLAYLPFWRVFPGMILADYACQQDGGQHGEGPIAVSQELS